MLLESPISEALPAQYQVPLPDSADVVIIGAGIIGIATALSLAEQGVKVLVCEKGRVAGEQSSRNWGWVRQTGRDEDELPLMIESLRLWRDAAARTGENSLAFSQQGVMYISQSEASTREFEEFIKIARPLGVDSQLLTAAQVASRYPRASDQWVKSLHSGLWTESDGRVEPWGAVPALARAAVRKGAVIKENCAVENISHSNTGVTEVITEQGIVRTTRVLLAGGMWSTQMARRLGLNLPQLAVKGTVARLENTPELFSGNTADDELAVARRMDGGYTMALSDFQEHFITRDSFRHLWPFRRGALKKLHKTYFRLNAPGGYPETLRPNGRLGTFASCRIMDPKADPAVVDKMLAQLKRQFNDCESASVSHAWAGMIETTPDFVPVLDEIKTIPGLFVATGFSGHGFGIGLGVGRLMADLLNDKPSDIDLSRFRFTRFSDGSTLKLGPI